MKMPFMRKPVPVSVWSDAGAIWAPTRKWDWLRSVALIVALTVFSMFAVIFPVISLVGLCIALVCSYGSVRWAGHVGVLIVIAVFSWMNIEKVPINDWAWYTQHYRWLNSISLYSYFSFGVPGLFQPKWTEPVYHLLAFTLTRLSNGNVAVLAFCVTALVYGCVAAGIRVLLRGAATKASDALILAIVPLLVGVTFTLTAQLVRQELAAAFMFLGFALAWQGRRSGLALLALAVLTHNSVVIPVGIVLGAWLVVFRLKLNPVLAVLVLTGLGALLGGVFLISPHGLGYAYAHKDDGQVSGFVFGLDAVLLSFIFVFRKQLGEHARLAVLLVAITLMYLPFLALINHLPIPFLRMYFYMDTLRVVTVALTALIAIRLPWGLLFYVPFVLGAIIYVELRILMSPFYFGGGLIFHLFYQMPLIF
jgi:hypothetical protein